jgi:hypothetical protein
MSAQSRVRRSFTLVVAALLAVAFVVAGGSAPASAAPVKGKLFIVSVADQAESQVADLPDNQRPFDIVQNRPFNVVVEVRDPATQELVPLTRDTEVVLDEVSGPGTLGGTIRATIQRDSTGTTISGATYSQFANGVELRVMRGRTGVDLAPSDAVSVNVALTATSRDLPAGNSLNLTDPNCGAPTSTKTMCGRLILPAGGPGGHVLMSVGSCDDIGDCRTSGSAEALVVTAMFAGEFTDTPAALVLACDKAICGQTGAGLPQIKVIYTFLNGGTLDQVAPPCPEKGVLGADQDICMDLVNSTRNQGDLYTPVLFDHDLRASHP